MKSYEEMAKSVFCRMEEYETAKKQRRKIRNRVILPLCGVFCMLIIGLGVWKGGWLQISSSSADEGIPTFDVPEGVNIKKIFNSWHKTYASVSSLVKDSDFVGVVQVTGVKEVENDSGFYFTTFTADVLEIIYSAEKTETIDIIQTGCRTETELRQMEGDPLLREGEKWLIFAWKNDSGTYTVLGPFGRFAYGGKDKPYTWLPELLGDFQSEECELIGGLTLDDLKARVAETLNK